jgi:Carbohydrate-selective porin, OprB family
MSKLILNLSGIFVLAACILAGSSARASEQSAIDSLDIAAVHDLSSALESSETSASQLIADNPTAVQTDAASSVKILQGLNDRYKCSTEKLDASPSREQFGSVLESCIMAMETKLAAEPTSIPNQDLEQLKQLTQAFRADIIALTEKVDKVEKAALAQSQVSQFSTTTKLVGEVIIAFSNVFGSEQATPNGNNNQPLRVNPIVSDRVRLNFRTSFDGKDLLQTRLQARNSNSFSAATAANTNQVRLGFEGNSDNNVGVQLLQYQKPFSEQTKIIGTAVGNELDLYVKNFNPALAPAGTGAISRFGRYNPIYRLSGEGAGLAIDHKFSKELGLSLAYAAPREIIIGSPTSPEIAGNPAVNAGAFGGSNLLFSQLSYSPSSSLDLGFIFARSYTSTGAGVSGLNGTAFANNPFGATAAAAIPTTANHYSLLASSKLTPSTTLSGWAGLTTANREDATGGTANIWNYAATLAFDNIGGAGNTLGFVVGLPPKVTSNTVAARVNNDTPFHLETFYKYQLSKNLFLTPGVVVILNPEGNAGNPPLFLGTIRTTFNF